VRIATRLLPVLALLLSIARAQTDWPIYGHDLGGTQYSPLRQITLRNVPLLKQAWVYHYGTGTSDEGDPFQDYRFEVTPIVVGGVMYLTTPPSRPGKQPVIDSAVVALEPETGKILWKHVFPSERRVHPRGIAYWAGDGTTAARVFFGTRRGYLTALDAKTGDLASGFGQEGEVDTYPGIVSDKVPPAWRDRYTVPNPVTVFRNLVITGSRPGMGEVGPPGPRGDIRAWDARTGKLVWTFHTVPQPGEPNHESWPGDSWKDRPGAGTWSTMTVDTDRGIIFAPLEAPQPDRRGEDRPGLNLYANSLIALDAATGKLLWYRQFVHHDVWDYDLPTPPLLIDVTRNGKKIPAVAQVGKTGLLFILERTTGDPIYPIEERPVPTVGRPGDELWPTQPFPLKPPPLARNSMTRADIAKITPELTAYCTKFWDDNRIQETGPYPQPKKDTSTLLFPGIWGGTNWGGLSFNPQLGYVFVNITNLPILNKTSVARRDAVTVQEATPGVRGPLAVGGFADPRTGTPCWAPPWGELTAVNVNTGDIAWKIPLGFTEALGEKGPQTGTFNLGGNIATASGLVFIAATNDRRLRAFDAKNGKELWSAELAASGHATPMTYLGKNGKQYVVIAAGGGTSLGNKRISDALTAFSLP